MNRFVSRPEGGPGPVKAPRKVLPVFAALCLAAGAALFSGCDLGGSPPPAPVIRSVSIKSNNIQTDMTDQGGTITVTWGAVEWATSYQVYYAPNVIEVPVIPAVPALTVNTTTAAITATITAAGIGNDTMDYYVWVKAVNGNGESAPSAPASTLDRFKGTWTASYGDYYYITNADVLYDNTDWPGYGVHGFIRAVIPFNNGETVNFNGHTGPAGVIIIEYDDSYMSDPGTTGYTWAGAPHYFNAVYYYGQSGSGAGAAAYLANAWATGGPEVDTVDEAIAKFTLADKDAYISSNNAVEYEWSE